mmetsp:Transcript_13479/g.52986  ORF Transcript_13479/g.52986 Transcript_13479/m.52986 type:complete len:260 (+) Transcript_13479:1728-2507(+)
MPSRELYRSAFAWSSFSSAIISSTLAALTAHSSMSVKPPSSDTVVSRFFTWLQKSSCSAAWSSWNLSMSSAFCSSTSLAASSSCLGKNCAAASNFPSASSNGRRIALSASRYGYASSSTTFCWLHVSGIVSAWSRTSLTDSGSSAGVTSFALNSLYTRQTSSHTRMGTSATSCLHRSIKVSYFATRNSRTWDVFTLNGPTTCAVGTVSKIFASPASCAEISPVNRRSPSPSSISSRASRDLTYALTSSRSTSRCSSYSE